jgi:hypothetical protein
MKVGDKYICNEDIKNIFGNLLFKKNDIYEVLDFDKKTVTLNHILLGNEYMEREIKILNKFTKIEDRNFFICECHSLEHQYIFRYDSEDKFIYCEPHLNNYLPFYKRIVLAIKYIFGFKTSYGSWDEFIFKNEDLDRLENIIKYAKEQKHNR